MREVKSARKAPIADVQVRGVVRSDSRTFDHPRFDLQSFGQASVCFCHRWRYTAPVASIDFPTYLQQAMTNAGYPRPVDVQRGTNGEVEQGVVARWLRGEGQEPSIRKLRPVAQLLGVPLLEMQVAAGINTAAEAGLETDPTPPPPRPTLEDLVRASPDYSPEMKEAMSALLAAARDGDKQRQGDKTS